MTLITYLTRVHFADGILEEALWSELESANKTRPLIVAEDIHLESEEGERFLSSFPVRTQTTKFTKIPHIPTEDAVRKVADLYEESGCDVVLAFGSSRAIDLAKVARISIAHSDDLATFSYKQGGSYRIGTNLPMLFAVPGISGFGSAVSAHAPVILSSGERTLVMCKKLIPTVTICDPTLTLKSTEEQTASAGANAITNCVEAYLSKSYNPPAEGIALDGLARAISNLSLALKDHNSVQARREMMAASLNGALALQKGLGATQAISNALETVSDKALDHGTVNRVVLPEVLRFNQKYTHDKFCTLRRIFGLEKDDCVAGGVNQYFNSLPLPTKLSDLGLNVDQLRVAATVASNDIATNTNPRQVGVVDYLDIMRSVH